MWLRGAGLLTQGLESPGPILKTLILSLVSFPKLCIDHFWSLPAALATAIRGVCRAYEFFVRWIMFPGQLVQCWGWSSRGRNRDAGNPQPKLESWEGCDRLHLETAIWGAEALHPSDKGKEGRAGPGKDVSSAMLARRGGVCMRLLLFCQCNIIWQMT